MLPTPPGLTPCTPHNCAGKAQGREHLGTGPEQHLSNLELTPLGLNIKQGRARDQTLIMNQFSPDVSPSSFWEDFGSKLSSLLGDSTPPGVGPPGPTRGPATPQTGCLLYYTQRQHTKLPPTQLGVLKLEGRPAGALSGCALQGSPALDTQGGGEKLLPPQTCMSPFPPTM